jgi:hypothetical protein
MTPAKYVVRARDFPVYGMVFEVVREGATWPAAMTATQHQARLVAAAFTQAEAMAAAAWDQTTEDCRAFAAEQETP